MMGNYMFAKPLSFPEKIICRMFPAFVRARLKYKKGKTAEHPYKIVSTGAAENGISE